MGLVIKSINWLEQLQILGIVLIGLFLIVGTVYLTYRIIKYFDPTCDILEGDITNRW